MKTFRQRGLGFFCCFLLTACAVRGEGYTEIKNGFSKAQTYLVDIYDLGTTATFKKSDYLYIKETSSLGTVTSTLISVFYHVNFDVASSGKTESQSDYLRYYPSDETIVTIAQTRYESTAAALASGSLAGHSGTISPN
jgi:hypothetical protein